MGPWVSLVFVRSVLAALLVPVHQTSAGTMWMRNGAIDTARASEFDFSSWRNRRAGAGASADAVRTWLLAFAAPGPTAERRAEVTPPFPPLDVVSLYIFSFS